MKAFIEKYGLIIISVIIAFSIAIAIMFIGKSCKQEPTIPPPPVPDTIGAYKIEQRLIGIDRKLDSFMKGQQEALGSIYSDMAKDKQTFITNRKKHTTEPADTVYKRVKSRLGKLEVKYD